MIGTRLFRSSSWIRDSNSRQRHSTATTLRPAAMRFRPDPHPCASGSTSPSAAFKLRKISRVGTRKRNRKEVGHVLTDDFTCSRESDGMRRTLPRFRLKPSPDLAKGGRINAAAKHAQIFTIAACCECFPTIRYRGRATEVVAIAGASPRVFTIARWDALAANGHRRTRKRQSFLLLRQPSRDCETRFWQWGGST